MEASLLVSGRSELSKEAGEGGISTAAWKASKASEREVEAADQLGSQAVLSQRG